MSNSFTPRLAKASQMTKIELLRTAIEIIAFAERKYGFNFGRFFCGIDIRNPNETDYSIAWHTFSKNELERRFNDMVKTLYSEISPDHESLWDKAQREACPQSLTDEIRIQKNATDYFNKANNTTDFGITFDQGCVWVTKYDFHVCFPICNGEISGVSLSTFIDYDDACGQCVLDILNSMRDKSVRDALVRFHEEHRQFCIKEHNKTTALYTQYLNEFCDKIINDLKHE